MARSPADRQPVLDAIARNAARFCAAEDCGVALVRADGLLEQVAHYGPMSGALPPWPVDRGSVRGRAIVERRMVHVEDMLAETEEEYPTGVRRAREVGQRTVLAAPMFREGIALGAIALRRTMVKPFTEGQIENLRLFNETKEALERQTAISDVLQTIGRSAFDLQPVLDTVVERAVRLCNAHDGSISTLEEGLYRTRSYWSVGSLPPEYMYFMRQEVRTPERGSLGGRTALEGRVVQIADALDDPEYKAIEMQQSAGYRTLLGVPLLRDGRVIGVFALTRNEVRPFTDRQIELVRTFADQA